MFQRAGALRGAYEAVDWSRSPVGDPSTWSPALWQAVETVWHTRFPATLLWGPDFALLYNAPYAEMIGSKHAAALGARTEDVFPEAWDVVGPRMQAVLAGEGAWYVEDELLPLVRSGFLEECWFTYSYSAVHAADGTIEGVVDITQETSRQVIDRRRLELLAHLGGRVDALVHRDGVPGLVDDLVMLQHPDLPLIGYRHPRATGRASATPRDGLPMAPRGALPESGALVERDGDRAIAWVPLRADGADVPDPPLLVVALNPLLPPDKEYLAFLDLVAATVRQGIDRLDLLEAERRILQDERALSEALQRSMLATPVQLPGLRVAVRYQPAAHEVQIGGDWYDAFVGHDGALMLTVGDVTGHDREAAAAMAQLRNLLRGLAFTLGEPPSAVVRALDEAMEGLGVRTIASTVLARVEDAPGAEPGSRVLRWTSAGHLPPVLLDPDGQARMLTAIPDLLLGVRASASRHDHEVALRPGSTVVLYTDGLVERRTDSLERGLGWLTERLAGRADLDAEELADLLMADLATDVEDDIAVLVLRVEEPAR